MALKPQDITQSHLDAMPWLHSIDFGGGLVSKGAATLESINAIRQAIFDGIEVNEKSFLDVGAWNGAYSFAAKQYGAARVVAADHFCWVHPVFRGRETFQLGKALLKLDIEEVDIDVPAMDRASVGSFDAVLFAGVFYHLIHAVYCTHRVATCARHLLIVETHQDGLDNPRPSMIFYPSNELNNDDTNWWGPNPQCIYEILKTAGFTKIFYRDVPGFDVRDTPHFRGRGLYHAFRDDQSMAVLGATAERPNWLDLSIAGNRAALFAPL